MLLIFEHFINHIYDIDIILSNNLMQLIEHELLLNIHTTSSSRNVINIIKQLTLK